MIDAVQFHSLAETRAPATANAAVSVPSAGSFSQVLRDRLYAETDVQFSAHAVRRLQERGIAVSPAMQARLEEAVDLAASKGCRESVVLIDGTAMVVNVPNRMVITAVVMDGRDGAVFTNIDSAVVMAN